MILIRRLYGCAVPSDQDRVGQVQGIFRETYPEVAEYAAKIPEMLNDPFGHRYRTILLVSENRHHRVTGFALVIHFPEIKSSLLDFLVMSARRSSWFRKAGTTSATCAAEPRPSSSACRVSFMPTLLERRGNSHAGEASHRHDL